MPTGARHIDRLLPRHDAGGLDLSWNVRLERVGFMKKAESYDAATIVDISLEGALVAVKTSASHEVGDEIDVRFRGLDGTATVKHIHRAEEGATTYGVLFRPDPDFRHAVDLAVGELRGRSSELRAAWDRQN